MVLATTLAVLWLVVGVALVGTIVADAVTASDDDCYVRRLGQAGESDWRWWPPGSYCTTPEGIEYREPSALRGWTLLVEVVVAAGLVVWWRTQDDVEDPDWAA